MWLLVFAFFNADYNLVNYFTLNLIFYNDMYVMKD